MTYTSSLVCFLLFSTSNVLSTLLSRTRYIFRRIVSSIGDNTKLLTSLRPSGRLFPLRAVPLDIPEFMAEKRLALSRLFFVLSGSPTFRAGCCKHGAYWLVALGQKLVAIVAFRSCCRNVWLGKPRYDAI